MPQQFLLYPAPNKCRWCNSPSVGICTAVLGLATHSPVLARYCNAPVCTIHRSGTRTICRCPDHPDPTVDYAAMGPAPAAPPVPAGPSQQRLVLNRTKSPYWYVP